MKGDNNKSESLLIEQCRSGNAKAQYKLYHNYSVAMYNVALRMTGNKEAAEDILQEAFAKAFIDLKKLKDDAAFGGWLKRIVLNKCIDYSRKKKVIWVESELINCKQNEPAEQEIEELVQPELVNKCIQRLPEGARHILVLRTLEGLKHAEISERMGVSESTVKTQFHRAKNLLAKMVKNEIKNGDRKLFNKQPVKS